jgi:hypothetical protein
VVIVKRTEGDPTSAPVGAHGHTAHLKQVCDVDPLAECCPEIVVYAVHETRIIALRSADMASEADEAVVTGVVRRGRRPTLSEESA